MNISGEVPANVYDLAEHLLELTRALIGKVAEAKFTDRLRKERVRGGTPDYLF
ncbi:hypothetical protein GGP55_003120 [Salinibacter ruber]|uniref:hypothetical protein n=1 Tax=Salinibacter ruber TaxID=146919 RepID=UPI0021679FD2|nr:hypothetical protein [Salinibacter ruber]MCS3632502.1 hypothetical protein [Salinibacter ruber]